MRIVGLGLAASLVFLCGGPAFALDVPIAGKSLGIGARNPIELGFQADANCLF